MKRSTSPGPPPAKPTTPPSVLDDLQRTTGTVTFDAGSKVDQPFSIAVADDDIELRITKPSR